MTDQQTIRALLNRVAALERRVGQLAGAPAGGVGGDPAREVFIATDPDDGTFQEQVLVSGSWVDFAGGRAVDDGDSDFALQDLPEETTAVLAVRQGDAFRYVRIGSAKLPAPQHMGQVMIAIADGQWGASFPFCVKLP